MCRGSEGGEERGEGGEEVEITAGQNEAEMTSDTPNNQYRKENKGKQNKSRSNRCKQASQDQDLANAHLISFYSSSTSEPVALQ